jgi:uncharacterized protein (UPF0332 family)
MNHIERKELIDHRLKRAKSTLIEVDLLVENKLWSTAVNRIYYACYYAVIALLLSKQITVQTHAGVRQMFGLHFIKSGLIEKELGKFYSDIFDKRQTGDYDDFVEFTGEEVKSLIPQAQELIETITNILS